MNGLDCNYFQIQHATDFSYEFPITRATMLLHLEPLSDAHQQVLNFEIEIEPAANPVLVIDSFGNRCHLLDIQSINRSSLRITSKAEVMIQNSIAALNAFDQPSWDKLNQSVDRIQYWDFLSPSKRVYDCPQLKSFMAEFDIRPLDNPFASLKAVANIINQNLRYEPGSTEVNSRMEDCLEQRSGVCQDYTHILLAVGRKWGIPSRYVSGYLHLFPEDGRIITDGVSHAWCEFFLPDLGWIGIDATNNLVVDNRYIRVSVGRDYDDIAPTKGVVYGGGKSSLCVNISLAHSSIENSDWLLQGAQQ